MTLGLLGSAPQCDSTLTWFPSPRMPMMVRGRSWSWGRGQLEGMSTPSRRHECRHPEQPGWRCALWAPPPRGMRGRRLHVSGEEDTNAASPESAGNPTGEARIAGHVRLLEAAGTSGRPTTAAGVPQQPRIPTVPLVPQSVRLNAVIICDRHSVTRDGHKITPIPSPTIHRSRPSARATGVRVDPTWTL